MSAAKATKKESPKDKKGQTRIQTAEGWRREMSNRMKTDIKIFIPITPETGKR